MTIKQLAHTSPHQKESHSEYQKHHPDLSALDQRMTETRSNKSNSTTYISANTMIITNYLCDMIESIIDQICQRVPSIPIVIRVFCKGLFDKNKKVKEVPAMISKYIIKDWLARFAFRDMVLNGLLKTYQIKTCGAQNIKLMGIVLNKCFLLDS